MYEIDDNQSNEIGRLVQKKEKFDQKVKYFGVH